MPKVVLAEDDAETAARYRRSLEEAGLDVVSVNDGTLIAEAVQEHNADIVVSDTELPGLGGDMACRRLLEASRRDILIVGLSNALDYGDYWIRIAHDFLHKPVIDEGYIHLGRHVASLYAELKEKGLGRYKEFSQCSDF